MEKDKITLTLTLEALETLDNVTSERKRGEYTSAAIVAFAKRQTDAQAQPVADNNPLGLLERIEAKLDLLLRSLQQAA